MLPLLAILTIASAAGITRDLVNWFENLPATWIALGKAQKETAIFLNAYNKSVREDIDAGRPVDANRASQIGATTLMRARTHEVNEEILRMALMRKSKEKR